MSEWTHVAGVIRVDYIEVLTPTLDFKDELHRRFGVTADYDDPPERWDRCNVPCGSEGSVQYEVIKTGKANSLAWGLVVIWGDLRDYTDVGGIITWIKDATEGLMIRNGVIEIMVEGDESPNYIRYIGGVWEHIPGVYDLRS